MKIKQKYKKPKTDERKLKRKQRRHEDSIMIITEIKTGHEFKCIMCKTVGILRRLAWILKSITSTTIDKKHVLCSFGQVMKI